MIKADKVVMGAVFPLAILLGALGGMKVWDARQANNAVWHKFDCPHCGEQVKVRYDKHRDRLWHRI